MTTPSVDGTAPRDDSLNSRLIALELSVTNSRNEVTRCHNTIKNLVADKQDLLRQVEMMKEKILQLEKGTQYLQVPPANGSRTGRSRAKDLCISVPNLNTTAAASGGLATPVSATNNFTPDHPLRFSFTPEENSANSLKITAKKKGTPATMLKRSPAHDLSSQLPPANVCFPLIPLTDVELIIFFFTSTSNPLVALRLYSRNWGPKEITDIINIYRDVKPLGYIRNTCSVRITSAIRRGQRQYGEHWQETYRKFFDAADDATATDAISLAVRLAAKQNFIDYRALAMTRTLKMFPNGKGAGIFTESLRWCKENNADVPLSKLHLVAIALDRKIDPTIALYGLMLSPGLRFPVPSQPLAIENQDPESSSSSGLVI